jgi:hypothetical protein
MDAGLAESVKRLTEALPAHGFTPIDNGLPRMALVPRVPAVQLSHARRRGGCSGRPGGTRRRTSSPSRGSPDDSSGDSEPGPSSSGRLGTPEEIQRWVAERKRALVAVVEGERS